MFSKENNILEFNPYQKSDKAPFLIYVDLARIIKKIDRCKNNPENSSTTNVSEHIPSGLSMSTISSFTISSSTISSFRGKTCMKKFCEFLREHALKIINKKMSLLTKEQHESYENAKICFICKKNLKNKHVKDKKYRKVRDH